GKRSAKARTEKRNRLSTQEMQNAAVEDGPNSPWQNCGTGAQAGGFHGQEWRFRTAVFPFVTGR
ncbi:MAG: hypothetical protein JXQ75_20865, partial [Phycisphaerae bacterium]|nr:hypothetical protein [Phycisphaerae bacterium]